MTGFGVTQFAPGTEPPHGRENTVQDVFAAAPGRVVDGSQGPARSLAPAQLLPALRELGVTHHRFSLAWARILPEGNPDPAALDSYRRWADLLRDNGIEPWVDLYRHDLPLSVMMTGGWLDRDTVDRFADYAALVADRLGDVVGHWFTVSDPFAHQALGHAVGLDAPGLTLLDEAWPVGHHLLLAHARARDVLRTANPAATVGISLRYTAVSPSSPSPADRRAATLMDLLANAQFADPVLLGRYPAVLRRFVEPHVQDGDLDLISGPLDALGVEHVHPVTVAAAPDNVRIPFSLVDPVDGPLGETGWRIDASALDLGLARWRRRYGALPPLVVTDLSASYAPGPEGDSARRHHLAAARHADRSGVAVHFHHSLVDEWEGADGFTRHHGLYDVDEVTGELSAR